MSINEMIKRFDEEFPPLEVEEEKLAEQIFEIIQKKLNELDPVVATMKKRGFYFFHPDLGTRIKTTRGIIVGRNIHDNSEIYVISANHHFVNQVDGLNNEVTKEAAMLTRQFVKVCDLDFLFKGLEHVENFLTGALEEKRRKNDEKRKLIDLYK